MRYYIEIILEAKFRVEIELFKRWLVFLFSKHIAEDQITLRSDLFKFQYQIRLHCHRILCALPAFESIFEPIKNVFSAGWQSNQTWLWATFPLA